MLITCAIISAAPGPPANISVEIDAEDLSIVLQWNAPADNGGSPGTLQYYVGYLVAVTDLEYTFRDIVGHGDIRRLLVMSSNAASEENPADFSDIDRVVIFNVAEQIKAALLNRSSIEGKTISLQKCRIVAV